MFLSMMSGAIGGSHRWLVATLTDVRRSGRREATRGAAKAAGVAVAGSAVGLQAVLVVVTAGAVPVGGRRTDLVALAGPAGPVTRHQ